MTILMKEKEGNKWQILYFMSHKDSITGGARQCDYGIDDGKEKDKSDYVNREGRVRKEEEKIRK